MSYSDGATEKIGFAAKNIHGCSKKVALFAPSDCIAMEYVHTLPPSGSTLQLGQKVLEPVIGWQA